MKANGLNALTSAGEHYEDTSELRLNSRMSYLEFINYFWEKDLESSFTADEVNLFFRLLRRANALKKGRFNLAVDKLMSELGIKTKRPFDTARKGLRDAGLLEFVNGNGRGCTTEYWLIGLEFNQERGVKNAPLSATLSAQFPHSFRNESVLLHKSKSKRESKGADAPAPALLSDQKRASKPPKKQGVALEEIAVLPLPHDGAEFANTWRTFYTTNTKQAGKPLTAFELMLKKLGKYPEAFAVQMLEMAIQGDWSGVENGGTTKVFAEWQANQARYPTPPPPDTTGPAVSTEVVLNDEVLAQRKAQAKTEAAAARRGVRAAHHPLPAAA